MTNTTVSDFWDTWPDAKECFMAVDPKTRKWVKGCAYKKATGVDKFLADRLIGTPASITDRPQAMSKRRKEIEDIFE